MAKVTRHGEIWLAQIDKLRPVVIASRDDADGVRDRTTVATITGTIRGIATEVVVDQSNGLDELSVINCDELTTIKKSRLVQRISWLSDGERLQLHRAMEFALGMET